MKLSDLLRPWCNQAMPDVDIVGVQNDSRQVKPGDLFLAYPGALVDGRLYSGQAIQAGAVAVAFDPDALPDSFLKTSDIPSIAVPQLSQQIAAIASRFYDEPTRALQITGVTGTNGKTTIAYQLASAYALLGSSAAYIGTLGQGDVQALKPVGNTTPDGLCLQRLFHEYRQAGLKHVCMEVSSHALAQQRVAHIDFTQAIFTNLTHEHLDYHQTMEAYAAAKAALFAMPTLQWGIVNGDDAYSAQMLAALPSGSQALTYGLQKGVGVRAVNVNVTMSGSTFDIISPWGTQAIRVKTVGAFNVYNSLAVFTSLMADGYSVNDVTRVMAMLTASPGRMELVCEAPCVIVDYAHTPDALEKALTTLAQLKKGRLWVVFGCGGDRDRAKRPMMGKIASQYADNVVLTSDNPRGEDPERILHEIATGLLPLANVVQIVDREAAIHHALKHAAEDDIVLIAGKGHESYQQIGFERFVFSDQTVVRTWFGPEQNGISTPVFPFGEGGTQ